jgi:transcription-repair coupling factor (superfamily II helicase)
MENLWSHLKRLDFGKKVSGAVESGDFSFAPASLSLILSFLHRERKGCFFFICSGGQESKELREEFSSFSQNFLSLPEPLGLPWEESHLPSPLSFHLHQLKKAEEKKSLILSPLSTSLLLLPSQIFSPLRIKRGRKVDLYNFLKRLEELGYENNFLVEREGEYSHRGSIVDIYPPHLEHPLRIDFSFDEVNSLREFSLRTQRSLKELEEVEIPPLKEAVFKEEELKRVERYLTSSHKELPRKKLSSEGVFWPYLSTSLRTLIPQKAQIFLTNFLNLNEVSKKTVSFWKQSFEEVRLEKGLKPPPYFPFLPLEKLLEKREYTELFNLQKKPFSLSLPPLSSWRLALEEIKRLLKEGFTLFFLGERSSLEEAKRELSQEEDLKWEKIHFYPARLYKSFYFPQQKIAFISLFEVSPKKRVIRVKRKESPYLPPLDLKEGDLVVHENHGIGEYRGMEKIMVDGSWRDYLVIKYADGFLKVPADQIGKVTRYYSRGGEKLSLSRLTTLEWSRKKERARQAARKLAIDLVRFYAKREATEGHAFPPDEPWQEELESSFPYEETPDQKRAILEVKRDMESLKPMDRLVFGDVGYGKTEVALRASFKAVLAGKQVMILVPTTVLAEQHYETFKERLSPYPVVVEVLSRFTLPKRERKILNDFSIGKIDILIGTHRLLSSDVKPKDLGLLIIDEEHRFGVEQKEKIKSLKENIDVLTLTATPIPRTLQMALSGIREVSVIETPPEARLPVVTYVGVYDEDKVKRAIFKELTRGGQVFYVHNRIESLPLVYEKLKRLIPGVKIALAHGGLKEDELEGIMWEFSEGEYDLLLCTTIIESGLDIPNANTLIVEGAEKLGLAQAYQLRGRVGRSERQAYAYFFFDPRKLSEEGWKRLQTLAELADLGSGLKLALKDLEIRGAGTLFGPEQHGHIQSLGFDLYTQMVKEAVEEIKGKKKKVYKVEISLPLPSFLPPEYIADDRLRLEFYHRLDRVQEVRELGELKEELLDRFGALPKEVKNLLLLVNIKIEAGKRGLRYLRWKKGELKIGGPGVKELEMETSLNWKKVPGEIRCRLSLKEAVSLLAKTFDAIIAFGE